MSHSKKPSIDELQDKIVDDFLSIGDPLSQYEYLLEFAGSLPPLADEEKTEENLVKGCQSKAWLVMEASEGELFLRADSDTLIIRGILHLLIDVLDGQKLADVASSEVFFPEKAELMSTFNSARRQGIASAIGEIQSFAQTSA